MKCDFCGAEEPLPFQCNYCGGAFCASHRLPEAHQCKGDLTQRRTIIAPPQTTFSWQSSYPPPAITQGRALSGVELRDIVVAWVALGFAFFFASMIGIYGDWSGLFGLNYSNFFKPISGVSLSPAELLAISLATLGTGFILHELSHKFTARSYGYWAEFRVWPFGLILALVTSLIGFIFAAPGATYISGTNISQEENGKISLAGPLTNIGVAALFLGVGVAGSLAGSVFWSSLGGRGTYFNIFLALFNMLPLGPLDGSKVFRWSKARWVSVFLPLVALFVLFNTYI